MPIYFKVDRKISNFVGLKYREMNLPNDRILILDGATGTMIQQYGLTEDDYRCGPFADCAKELRGNNECLNLTHPEIIKAIHEEYIAAGADIIETNTFSANRISQAEYGCEEFVGRMAYEGARIAREAADRANMGRPSDRQVLVAGSIGPTSKSLSLSPDVSDPAFRTHSFDDMKKAYREQAEALIEGGADILLVETCFDALNVKAALAGIMEYCRQSMPDYPAGYPPVMLSVSVGDRSGRTLTGQTLEAFYTAVRHYPIVSFGLNCSLGAAELMPLVDDMSRWCGCAISCYPNAGLPNEMGGYDQSPAEMAAAVKAMASKGLLNIAGGCCGTTPEHIRAIAGALDGIRPRDLSVNPEYRILTVSGLEAVKVDVRTNNFTNVGERTNVAGSRKFARLISEGKYDEGLRIAAKQIEDGATIIDINMDDAMLDSAMEMERFVRYVSNDPAVAKAALMIDSSHWETIIAGLTNAQGKCIVNSISLKEGEEAFIEKARTIRSLGAAMVVMAFDEKGQATTYDRKVEICSRAYRLLTEKAGVQPEDIIFDVNILSIGTGIEEHARYAADFIEAVRWIKANLPGALTSGGVSNLSFAFRGNNAVREAMHSAFLYHAIKAGLDMAIVNPSMLQVYDEIEPELLRCVEDVIFDTDPSATERLIDKAARMLEEKSLRDGALSSPGNGMSSSDSSASFRAAASPQTSLSTEERLKTALIKGSASGLEDILAEAMEKYGSALDIIEGPLMEGMEAVGKMFGEGKMFLPQVVKSAKIMKDAVDILNLNIGKDNKGLQDRDTRSSKTSEESRGSDGARPDKSEGAAYPSGMSTGLTGGRTNCIVLATVKGDVHDIGKNILGIVLSCNGFKVKDLGVMVDKETILDEAQKNGADIIAVSGLITPSLYQMEELCREMTARGMDIPLFVGGATTSALHTAVKLAPLYSHVFHGTDASASAVMAKRCMMNRETFEKEQHEGQERLRVLYNKGAGSSDRSGSSSKGSEAPDTGYGFPEDTYPETCPHDITLRQLTTADVMPYFDWKMFYAIWGVKYGSAVPEVAELMQLRRDAEDELAAGQFRIMVSARFLEGCSDGKSIISDAGTIPMMRQETGERLSLCDYVISQKSGRRSPFGVFAISVHPTDAHVTGCSCPACTNRYEDLVARTVRQTLAEAASEWVGRNISEEILHSAQNDGRKKENGLIRIVRPAAGYASCPDHSLKKDILQLLGEEVHICGDNCRHDHRKDTLGITMTDSYAMMPESSICGLMFMHPQAGYPDIRICSVTGHGRRYRPPLPRTSA